MDNKNYLKCDSKLKYLAFLILYFFLYVPCFILYHRKKIWLICERGTDAQDNGFVFYKYLKDNHNEIRVFYLISKSSPDISKIDRHDIVYFGSVKHFMLSIGCKVQISSHLFGYCPWKSFMLYLRKHKTRNIHVFLQHGITYNNQYGFYKKVCKALDFYICGSSYEQDYICDAFGYDKNEAVLTGFARFDNLYSGINEKYILIMPTWRRYLMNVDTETFNNSSYYKHWRSLLENPTLNELSKRCRLEIVFYLHSSLQPFSDSFNDLNNISLVRYGEISVQELLKASAILITDYSSVFFDCLYMNKSTILYQFDKDDFIKGHYNDGYSNNLNTQFINIETTEVGVIRKLKESVIANDQNKMIALSRYSNNFFGLKDQNNCNRIFETISKKL